MSLPTGSAQDTLACAHEHKEMNWLITEHVGSPVLYFESLMHSLATWVACHRGSVCPKDQSALKTWRDILEVGRPVFWNVVR